MQFTMASALLAIVVFQLLFIAFFLLTLKKGKRQSNVFLGIFFLMIGISMLDMWLSIHGLYKYFARLAFLDDGFILALGPLIYLYAKSIMYEDFRMGKSSYVHFIPFFLISAYFMMVSLMVTWEEHIKMVEDVQSFNLPFFINLIWTSFYLHAFVYLLITYREIKKYQQLIHEEYSSLVNRNYEWLDFTVKSLGIIILLAIIHALVPYSFSSGYGQVSALFFIGFIFFFSNRVILKGLLQPGLFSGITSESRGKYIASNLTSEQRKSYQDELIRLIQNDKPFLDPDLTIDQLAGKMDIPAKRLSQVINQSFNKSFFDFINTYRVEEAKSIFDSAKDDKLTVQEVMYQSGFNSKSSFIAFFKRLTGMNPSEYKKKVFNNR